MSDLDRLADDYNAMRRERDQAQEDAAAMVAEAERARAERDEARARLRERNFCGQEGRCAIAPGCDVHWGVRVSEALEQAAKWRRLLGYVTSCPSCGAEPGCNIDCATCMDWP